LEITMDEEAFSLSLRKFLKLVGVSSEREIEQAVARALRDRLLSGVETLDVAMTLQVPGVGLRQTFEGKLKLQ
jgi:hypothetical protein